LLQNEIEKLEKFSDRRDRAPYKRQGLMGRTSYDNISILVKILLV